MQAIIAALIAAIAPLVLEWIRKWIEDKLKAAAEVLPEPSQFVSDEAAVAALFDEAIKRCPRVARARKFILRLLRDAAMAKAGSLVSGTFKLSQAEANDILETGELAAQHE